MLNLHRINYPNPMLFLGKFIKNNKGGRGMDTKLCMFTHKMSVNIPHDKNMMFHFTSVSNSSVVKKVTLFFKFATAAALIELGSL